MDRVGITHVHHLLPAPCRTRVGLAVAPRACVQRTPAAQHAAVLRGADNLGNVASCNRYAPSHISRKSISQLESACLLHRVSDCRGITVVHPRRQVAAFEQGFQAQTAQAPHAVTVSTGDCGTLDLPDNADRLRVHRSALWREHLLRRPQLPGRIVAPRPYRQSHPEAIIDRAKGKDAHRLSARDAALLRGIPPGSQAGPLDDRGVP